MKQTLLFLAGLLVCTTLHARGDNNLPEQNADGEKAAVVAEKQDANLAPAPEDRSTLKLIDDLTEKLYLQRKKRWEKDQANLIAK